MTRFILLAAALLATVWAQGSTPDPNCVTEITVPFATNDLNNLKTEPVCTKREDCWMTWKYSMVRDKVYLPIAEDLSGVLVTNYTRDTTAPQLSAFLEFNMNNGTIRLLFNEVS